MMTSEGSPAPQWTPPVAGVSVKLWGHNGRLDDGQVWRVDITVTARPATPGEAGARWR